MIRFKIILILIIVLSKQVFAEEFLISNNELIISGGNVGDSEKILELLEENQAIETIILKEVWGGTQDNAIEILDLIIDFELDTHISGYCWGNCIFIFMAGENRTMERGAEIAIEFHSYTFDFLKEIIEDKTYEVIGSLEEYIIWIDNTSREEIVEYFSILIERGADPKFVIESVRKGSIDTYVPRRKILLKANILTE